MRVSIGSARAAAPVVVAAGDGADEFRPAGTLRPAGVHRGGGDAGDDRADVFDPEDREGEDGQTGGGAGGCGLAAVGDLAAGGIEVWRGNNENTFSL